MSQTNQVSFSISEADMAEIKTAIQTLQTKLMPHLKTLSPDDRMELPKMGNKTFSFVQKAFEHCQQNPDLVPQFLDVNEYATDLQGFQTARSLYQPVFQISERAHASPLGHHDLIRERSLLRRAHVL
jgi:hypothetical protein